MFGLLSNVEYRMVLAARRAARTIVFGVAIGLCLIGASILLSVAAFVALANAFGTALAALILGVAYLLVALLLTLVMAMRPRLPPPAPPVPLGSAFLMGMQSGRAMAQGVRRGR